MSDLPVTKLPFWVAYDCFSQLRCSMERGAHRDLARPRGISVCMRDVQALARRAQAVIRDEQPESEGVTCSPWNQFSPKETHWWIVPTTAWPAYRHGKLFLTQEHTDLNDPKLRDEARLYLGLHIESGLTPAVASQYGAKSTMIRDSDWMWDSFLESLADGSVAKAAEDATGASGARSMLVVGTGYPSGADDDRRNWISTGAMRWQINGSRLTADRFRGVTLVEELTAVRSMKMLHDCLGDASEWQWVDFLIGVVIDVHVGETTADDESTLGDCLRPWLTWFR